MSLPDVGGTSVKNGGKLRNLRSRILNENKVDNRFTNFMYRPVFIEVLMIIETPDREPF